MTIKLITLVFISLLLSVVVQASEAPYINKLTEYFPEDVLAATIKNVDDYDGVAVGTKKVLQNYKTLDDFESGIKVCNGPCRAPTKIEVAENLKNTGKAAAKGIPTVKLSELPKEAEDTVKLIEKGGPFPYPNHDGGIFDNRVPFGKKESLLPENSQGYYHEYTVETPGAVDRAKRRIVTGKNGEIYYTDDHFDSFKQVMKNGE